MTIFSNDTKTNKGLKLVQKYKKISSYHHFELLDDIYKLYETDDIKNIKSCNALIRRFNKSKNQNYKLN